MVSAVLAYTFSVGVKVQGFTYSSVPMSYGSTVDHKSPIKDKDNVMLALEETKLTNASYCSLNKIKLQVKKRDFPQKQINKT